MRRAAIAAALAAVACGGRREEEPRPAVALPPVCAVGPAGPFSGEATRYDADGTGSCSFEASADRRVAAIAAADYAKAAWCGACAEVTGPDGRVVVRIVDRCPACKAGDLDLSREAFASIAAPSAGRVRISWRPVPCEVEGPIAYRFKDGSSRFWTAIQVRNHRYAIASLDARDRTGGWRPLSRTGYNYFLAEGGLGPGPFALRVTDVRGQVIEDARIPEGAAVTHPGAAQLARCRGD
jgi:expansin (peptidoglycan-binding protein)